MSTDTRTAHWTATRGTAHCGQSIDHRQHLGETARGLVSTAAQYPAMACPTCLEEATARRDADAASTHPADEAKAAAKQIIDERFVTPTLDDVLLNVAFFRHLEAEIERWISAEVATARVFGADWADIGEALGVSKQAANKRYRDV